MNVVILIHLLTATCKLIISHLETLFGKYPLKIALKNKLVLYGT